MIKQFSKFLVSLLAVLLVAGPAASTEPYWQQEVNYSINVTVKKDNRTIFGTIAIEYINNSPDSLDRLYIKAFPNAIQKDSYADYKRRSMNDYSFAGLERSQEGSLELIEIGSEKSKYFSLEKDNTIYTVYLTDKIAPAATFNISFEFKTVLPSPHNLRMGYTQKTTKAAYWYPQVCVYDRKMGWVNSQYIGWGETYGDFGDFDVRIKISENQVVAASGLLINEQEVLPDSLRSLLDIKNYFAKKSEWPKLNFDENKTKTWHYLAESVNDFAFTFSEDFCIDSDTVKGVEVVAYPLKHKAKSWERAVEIGKQSIVTFSELIFPYQWPVMRICDAFSGMEFPMITNCSGGGPSPRFALLLYHEIGHQWFMGQVGSNQLDRPFLDEGFTTHLEHIAMEKYLGREGNYDYFTNWYQKKFSPPTEDRHQRGFRQLLLLMKLGFDKQMVFSYDRGEEYFPYRVSAYYKSAAMHYSLRSIFGDSAYYQAMQHYCAEWFFKHPYEEDFLESMEAATGIQLDHYLEQWYHSRYRLDYAFDSKKTSRKGNSYRHKIKLKRPGDFVAPIDMAVIWEQGDTSFYTIPPEGMAYKKKDFALLPIWNQFRRLSDSYETTITSQREIKKIILDPFELLMDIDRTNNSSDFLPPIELRLDNMFYDRVPVNKYALRLRPDFWYDNPNGVHLGFHAHGSYLDIENKFSLDFRIGTRSGRPQIDFEYSTPFEPFGYQSTISNRLLRTDFRTFTSFSYEKRFKKFYSRPDFKLLRLELNYLNLDGKQQNRLAPLQNDVTKYLNGKNWDAAGVWYTTVKSSMLRTFRYGSYSFSGQITVGTYSEDDRLLGFQEGEYAANLKLENSAREYFSLSLHYLGTDGEPPSQFVNHLSRGSAVSEFVSSRVFRSPGTIPNRWENDIYLFNGRVRGYQERNVYLTKSFGASLSITPPDLLPYYWLRKLPLIGGFLSKIDQSLFADGAFVSMQGKELSYSEPIRSSETLANPSDEIFYFSAGISLVFPPVWSEHRVRLDFPLYLNKPLAGEKEFDFRFSIAWILPTDF
ncbi:MAG: M1 family metallopeptidase [candidate division Zixibacteria bacterium]|nr:M1 family metallopeptidase [candidate division Zixibacteria bacterium]